MLTITDTLVVIPARGGSKGLPGKNIKPLNGKPLIWYTIEAAREVFPDQHICVSTDDSDIIRVVEQTGLKVPFVRPANLATDTAGSWEVVKHAYDHYLTLGHTFSKILLLQPTSPLRTAQHIREAYTLFKNTNDAEMVVSVKEAKSNPYFNLFEPNEKGFLYKSKEGNYKTRQECPKVYELNGAIYLLKSDKLKKILDKRPLLQIPYLMSINASIDIDTSQDLNILETIIHEHSC